MHNSSDWVNCRLTSSFDHIFNYIYVFIAKGGFTVVVITVRPMTLALVRPPANGGPMFYYLLFQLLYNMCFDCIFLYVVQDEAAMGRWTPTASTNGQHQSLIRGHRASSCHADIKSYGRFPKLLFYNWKLSDFQIVETDFIFFCFRYPMIAETDFVFFCFR